MNVRHRPPRRAWMPCLALCVALAGSAAAQTRPAATDLDRLSADLESLSRRVSPAVVQVFVSGFAAAGGGGEDAGGLISRKRGSGSGVILDAEGFIVTNAHVVEGARRVQVQLSAPRPGAPTQSTVKPAGLRLEARVVGIDRETDLAVLDIEGTGHPTLPLADSDALRQGQIVLAIGSPLGLENSVSIGVVSAPVRQIEPDSPMIHIQTDAAIHPGNSGGPLIDTRGNVVGINTLILDAPAGDALGFAVPSNIVSAVYRSLRQHGAVRRGEIGARAQTVTPELARGLGFDRDWGVVLADVYPGGPADAAGLRPGDLVLELDGKPMENARQFDVNLYRRAGGDEVAIEYRRDGAVRTARVRLTERSGDLDRLASLANPEEHLVAPLQVLGFEVDASLAGMIPMREPWGVLVAASTGNASPGGAPLLPGDVIRSLDRSTIRTLADLRGALAKHASGEWVVLHVERRGRMLFVPCEVP